MTRLSLAVLLLLPVGARAAELSLAVDARELPRHLLHADLTIPCRPGPLRLWYPKWVPGTHAPAGPVQNIGGLRLETADGLPLAWHRDEVEPYCVLCDVPAGATAVRARLDYICNESGPNAVGAYSAASRTVGVINWNTCLLCPGGADVTSLQARLRLKLPAGWRYATALKTESEAGGEVAFAAVSLAELLDCPLIAGEHLRTFPLAGTAPPAFLDIASESPAGLQLPKAVIDKYARVAREAVALFGAAHYPAYHFLVVCSDELGYFGLEHLACGLNGVGERDLIDDKKRRGWVANLLPHEYVHSWNGKFRRPAGMVTTDFHTPQRTKLLWVYEGLTEYYGEVLLVRSGLIDADEYRGMLAWTLSDLTNRAGRRWRPLEDTAVAGYLLRGPSLYWGDLRRSQDFYFEGMLLWLEADAIIRNATDGRRSLDDFCKQFFGPVDTRAKVVPYELADVVAALKAQADYDWAGFFARRVTLPEAELPLDVVGKLGYRLRYGAEPSAYQQFMEEGSRRGQTISARDSLGLAFSEDGRVLAVVPGKPGDKAGLTAGAHVIGVNGWRFSRHRLRDALADSVSRRKVELLLTEGERFRTVVIDYADGPRYLELVRDPGKADVLGEILKPRTKGGE